MKTYTTPPMERIASTLVFMALIGASQAHAQCDLLISSFIVNVGCEETDPFPVAQVAVNGGTPPYSYAFVTNEGFTTTGQSADAYWSRLMTNGFSSEYSAALTVTDAEGCIATADYSWIPHWPVTAVLEVYETCDDSIRFQWNGTFVYQYTDIPVDNPCAGPFIFGIGSGTGNYVSGTVEEDWTEVSPGQWLYQLPLSFGAGYVGISNSAGFCDISTQIQCYKVVYLWDLPVTPAANCFAQFSVRSALGGAFPSGPLMTDQLRTNGLLPTVEPYSALGYSFVGTSPGQSVAPALFSVTGNNAVVDWVVVELRSAVNPSTILHSRPALLQRDGDVVGLNGSAVFITTMPTGAYHVAVRHRNHLGVMTATPRSLSSTVQTVDFTSSATAAFGTNARANVNGTMVLWPGDGNGDGAVRYIGNANDRDPVLIAIGGSVPTAVVNNVYDSRDVNMDGGLSYAGATNDRDLILQTIGGTLPTAVLIGQLP